MSIATGGAARVFTTAPSADSDATQTLVVVVSKPDATLSVTFDSAFISNVWPLPTVTADIQS